MKISTPNPLNFNLSPATVFISTNPDQSSYANISLSMENAGTDALNVNSIAITLPPQLAPQGSLGSITPVAGQPDLWSFGPSTINVGEFDAESQSGEYVVMNTGDTWQFTLQLVTLVSAVTAPSAAVTAEIILEDGSSIPASLNVNIYAATKKIISFNSQPADINPGQSATLSWQCEGMNYCIISPIDDTHRNESGSLFVRPDSTIIYTLYAFGDGVILSAQWAVSVDNPQIVKFGGIGGQTGVDYNNNITLTWTCNQFTKSVAIVSDTGITIPPLDTGGNTPQQGSISVGPVIEQTTFTLTAYGNNTQDFTTGIAPININDVTATLTASPHSGLWQQDKVTLNWNIESAVTVSLSPSIPNGPTPQNLVGSADINPAQDVTYILAVTGFKGNAPVSYSVPVSLAVTPVLINAFYITPPIISPDLTQNQAELSWNTQAQVASLSGVGTVNTNDTHMLTTPADGATYTLTAGTNQNPGLVTETVQVGSLCGPYNFSVMVPDIPGLAVEIENPAQISNLTPNAAYNVALTGVVVSAGTAPTNYFGVFESALNITGFGLLNQPFLNYGWADPNNKTGTVTILSSTNPVVGPFSFTTLQGDSYGGPQTFYILGITIPGFANQALGYCVQLTGVAVSGGPAPSYYMGLFVQDNNDVIFMIIMPIGLTMAWADPNNQTGTVTFLGLVNPTSVAEISPELIRKIRF